MLTPSRGLSRGFSTLVAESVTTTGTDQVRPFSVGGTPGHNPVVRCQLAGTADAYSGNLEESHDGQSKWSTFLAFDFGASEIFLFDAAPGVSYRFNATTVTTPVTLGVRVTLS
jgi:hypothetical protein